MASTPHNTPPPDAEHRLREALAAHARGWKLTPLRGKVPVQRKFPTCKPPTERTVREWAAKGNVGLVTGKQSGVIVIDFDIPKGATVESVFPDGAPWTPTVDTGSGGLHFYFSAPNAENMIGNSANALAPKVDVRGQGGQVVYPGSIHPETKQPYAWRAGLSPDDVPLAPIPEPLLKRLLQAKPKQTDTAPPKVTEKRLERYAQAALDRETAAVLAAPEGARNDVLNTSTYKLAQLVGGGVLNQAIVETEMTAAAEAAGLAEDPDCGPRGIAATIRSAMDAGIEKPRAPQTATQTATDPTAQTTADSIPIIEVSNESTKASGIVAAAELALLRRPEPVIFQRSHLLVRVTKDKAPKPRKGYTRQPNTPVITQVPFASLLEKVSTSARWKKYGKQAKGWVDTLPPVTFVGMLHSRGEWSFPYLESVAEAPFLRPDGSVRTVAGYDLETRVFLAPGCEVSQIDDEPTLESAQEAFGRIYDVLDEFPFVSNGDGVVPIAALLTVLARPAIAGPVPMFVFTKPTPGSGATLIADVVSTIATGRKCGRMTWTPDVVETRKLLLSVALEGAPLVLLDNCTGVIGNAALSAALTAGAVQDRLLGTNQIVTAEFRTVMLATGTGLSFRGDVQRRKVACEIDPRMEHPEDRQGFKYPDLCHHVGRHRGELLHAALTILRAYHVAGRPAHSDGPPMGSFEEWDSLVRGAVIWSTGEDPLASEERFREEGDADMEALRTLLVEWDEAFSAPVTAAAAVSEAIGRAKAVPSAPGLRDALAEVCGCPVERLDSRRLGYRLRGLKRRIAGGMKFVRSTGHRKITRYEVVHV